jgi:hypothetical protein
MENDPPVANIKRKIFLLTSFPSPLPDHPGMAFHINYTLKNMVKYFIIFDSPHAWHDRGE